MEAVLERLRQLSPFSIYSHFKIRDLENVGQVHDVQLHISSGAIRLQTDDFLSDGSSNIFSIFHSLRDIRNH